MGKGWCKPNPNYWPGNLQYVTLPESFSEFFSPVDDKHNCVCDKGYSSCVKPEGKGLVVMYSRDNTYYDRTWLVQSGLSEKHRT